MASWYSFGRLTRALCAPRRHSAHRECWGRPSGKPHSRATWLAPLRCAPASQGDSHVAAAVAVVAQAEGAVSAAAGVSRQPRSGTASRPPNQLSPAEACGQCEAPLLTALLHTANTSERVLGLCAAHAKAGRLNPTHVGAALHALGRVAAARRVPGGGRQGRGRVAPQGGAAWVIRDSRLGELLQLAVQPDAAWVAAGHLPCSATDLVSSLRGVVALRWQSSPVWRAGWEALASERAQTHAFPPRELSGAVWCYATLGLTPGTPWAAACEVLLQQCVSGMKPQELAAVCWSFGARSQPPSKATALALQRAVLKAAEAGDGDAQALGPREAANILWGVARWDQPGGVPQGQWAGKVAGCVAHRLVGGATPQEVANVVWALSKLCGPFRGNGESHLPAHFWPHFDDASLKALPSMNARNLCAVAGAVAMMRWQPSAQWMAAFETQTLVKAHKLCPHQARTLLGAWRRMAWAPPQEVLALVGERLAPTPPIAVNTPRPAKPSAGKPTKMREDTPARAR
jgi:hypothetical protein